MARGRRKSVEEQITLLDEQIQAYKEKLDAYTMIEKGKIKELQAQRQDLLAQKRATEIQNLFEMMEEKGVTISEIEEIILESENRKKIG